MATQQMNLVDAIGEFVPRLARNRSAVLRSGRVMTVPADGFVKVAVATGDVTCPYLGSQLAVGDWVTLLNDSDKWIVLGRAGGSGTDRGAPFAVQAGYTRVDVPGQQDVVATKAINFITGRFTVMPHVLGTCTNAKWNFAPFPITAAGMTVRVDRVAGTDNTFYVDVNWLAIQMTPTSGTG